jgi:hypothetical protein
MNLKFPKAVSHARRPVASCATRSSFTTFRIVPRSTPSASHFRHCNPPRLIGLELHCQIENCSMKGVDQLGLIWLMKRFGASTPCSQKLEQTLGVMLTESEPWTA